MSPELEELKANSSAIQAMTKSLKILKICWYKDNILKRQPIIRGEKGCFSLLQRQDLSDPKITGMRSVTWELKQNAPLKNHL